MAKWHYMYIEEIKAVNNIKSGEYYTYDIDTFDYIMNSENWVATNDAYEERRYVGYCYYSDWGFESIDGKLVYIPCFEVSNRLEEEYATVHTFDDLLDW